MPDLKETVRSVDLAMSWLHGKVLAEISKAEGELQEVQMNRMEELEDLRSRVASNSERVTVIPRRIQDALDELGIKADGGYFSTGAVFTAWWHQNPVAVLDYQRQTKTWALRPKGQKGPRFDWDTMSTSGVPSRRVAARYLSKRHS